MMDTSGPRTFSSILTKISPSANRRIVTAHNGCPKCLAISSASGRLAVPASSNNWLRESERSAMCALQNRKQTAPSRGVGLVLFRLGGLERAAGGRDAVHVPGVHAVHGGPLAAHSTEVAHHKARRGGVERERQEQAATSAHAEAALRTERLGRVHFLGCREPRGPDGLEPIEVAVHGHRIGGAAVDRPGPA